MNTVHTTLRTSALGLCLLAALVFSGCSKAATEAAKPAVEAAKTPTTETPKAPTPEAAKKPVPKAAKAPQAAKTPAATAAKPPVLKSKGHKPKNAPPSKASLAPIPKDAVEVEASCGQCQFGLTEPRGCDLAVRIDGEAHFVDGSHIDDHGDAHARRGMCNTIRRAAVTGEVVNNRFVARTFRVID